MAEPTLKDVLDAITKLDARVARVEGEMATKADLAKVDSNIDSLRNEMAQRFDELDAELTLHAKVHRKIEADITALKGRPPRTAARPTRRPRAR